MATINIANLTFTHKGNYDGSVAYVKNDVVYYATNGNAYIAKQNTTGNVPTNGTYWSQFAAGSGGIWNAGLSLGSAGQAVKVNAAANALEFGTISSPVKKTYYKLFKGGQSISGFSSSTGAEVPNYNLTITPQSTSSVFLASVNVSIGSHADHTLMRVQAKTGSGSYTPLGNAKASMHNSAGYFDFGSFHVGGDPNQVKTAGHIYYYAPATTSAITFALFCYQHSSTSYFGRSSNSNTTDDYSANGMTIRVDEYSSTSDLVFSEYTSG